jgi:UDP-N-acetylmuramate dehydrogenase
MERFTVAESAGELGAAMVAARTRGEPFFVLGNGSNLLVPDRGLRGTTVRLAGALRAIDVVGEDADGVELRVGAGALNAVVLQRHLGKLAGLGPLAGVPGTMGGAVAMNAGTALGEIGGALVRVEGLDHDGRAVTLERADLPMRYREGGLPSGYVVTAAVLRLRRDGAEAEQARVVEHLARRKATQPLDLPSCGSVFRNPAGFAAGQLIEAAGLKGWRRGGAQISEKHANFIVNLGDARASDVLACMRKAWDGVYELAGIQLVPEVHVVGEWNEKEWPFVGSVG